LSKVVSLQALLKPSRSNPRKAQSREAVLFNPQKVFNKHLPSFLANTCLAFHIPTKVFTNSRRQVVSHWNCLRSNYRPSSLKKQVRQVFLIEPAENAKEQCTPLCDGDFLPDSLLVRVIFPLEQGVSFLALLRFHSSRFKLVERFHHSRTARAELTCWTEKSSGS
jgi:hypothetical protein